MIRALEKVPNGVSVPAPFSRLVAWGIFDGPTQGLLADERNNEYVAFRLLSWDDAREVRVFGLSQVAPTTAASIVRALSSREEPGWPEWWVREAIPIGSPEETMAAQIDARIDAAQFVVVTQSLLGLWTAGMRVVDGNRGEYLRLAEFALPDDEVSVGAFEEWLEFCAAAMPNR